MRTQKWDTRDARTFDQLLKTLVNHDALTVNSYLQQFHPRKRAFLAQISQAMRTTRELEVLKCLLRKLAERGIIDNFYILRCISSIANNYPARLRDIDTWSVSTRNPRRQAAASALLRHLFCMYDVPVFMDRAFYEGNETQQFWFLYIGCGANIRTAPGLPIHQMTKKMAHYFHLAPPHYTIAEALRWAQIHGIGGNKALTESIRSTRLANKFFPDAAFEVNLLRYINAHFGELNPCTINLIIEYVNDQRFVPRRVFTAGGAERQLPPPQPNFSFKGRAVKNLLADAVAWEKSLSENAEVRVLAPTHPLKKRLA